MKILYQGNGFAVLEIDGQLKISWAEGMIGKPVFYDITEENFERLKRSEKDVKDVLFFCKNGIWPLTAEEDLEADREFLRECPELLIEIPDNQELFDKEELEVLLKKAKEKQINAKK